MLNKIYPFAEGDRLQDRNTYQYIPYTGQAFLNAWDDSRVSTLALLPDPIKAPAANNNAIKPVKIIATSDLMEWIMAQPTNNKEANKWLYSLIRKFETTKRLHKKYDQNFKAVDKTLHRDFKLYIRFAELCERSYISERSLINLNAFIKVIDTLCAYSSELKPEFGARLANLIHNERTFIIELQHSITKK